MIPQPDSGPAEGGRLYFIRHARVAVDWPARCTSEGFAAACRAYDAAPIVAVGEGERVALTAALPEDFVLHVSSLGRSAATAAGLFPGRAAVEHQELDEVSLGPYKASRRELATWRWLAGGRLRWLLGLPVPGPRRSEVEARVTAFLAGLKPGRDHVVVGHGFWYTVLAARMRRSGRALHAPGKLANLECAVFRLPDQSSPSSSPMATQSRQARSAGDSGGASSRPTHSAQAARLRGE